MTEHKSETLIDSCTGCAFADISDAADMVCSFEPNFAAAPKKRHLKLSDVSDEDIKRKDDKTLCVLVDWFYRYDKKPGWCRLKKTSLTYE